MDEDAARLVGPEEEAGTELVGGLNQIAGESRSLVDGRVDEAATEQACGWHDGQRQVVGTGIRDGNDPVGIDDDVFDEVARQVAAGQGDLGVAGNGRATPRRQNVGGALQGGHGGETPRVEAVVCRLWLEPIQCGSDERPHRVGDGQGDPAEDRTEVSVVERLVEGERAEARNGTVGMERGAVAQKTTDAQAAEIRNGHRSVAESLGDCRIVGVGRGDNRR